jgi:deoxyadenosine/deoxycytidine kinase
MKVVIDGNIGSGKTTQLNLLGQKGWTVQREPIDEWPLELFYKDKSRWALLLQMKILQTLQPVKTRDKDVVVYERCLLSTRHVFWEYLVKHKLVRPEEDSVYSYQYDKDVWFPDVYIFLSKTPAVAFEHIKKRKQSGDSGVSLEYLKDLDVLYARMLTNVPCKVHVINAHQTPEDIHQQILSLLKLYGMYVSDSGRAKVQTSGAYQREVLCTPFPNMCSLS